MKYTILVAALLLVAWFLSAHVCYSRRVGKILTETTFESVADVDIDAVFTWVNGTDPDWLAAHELKDNTESEFHLRFGNGKAVDVELEKSVHLLLQNAPWVRRIFIVVANLGMAQTPPFLLKANVEVTLIPHSQIFPRHLARESLPTFNSHAIEANLHRIPGLSECFLYFNDDMLLLRSLQKHKCFASPSIPIAQKMSRWTHGFPRILNGSVHAQTWHRMATSRDLAPVNAPWHGFVALTKTIMRDAENDAVAADAWRKTIASRYRRRTDIAPIGLAMNIALKNNKMFLASKQRSLTLWHFYRPKDVFPANADIDGTDVLCINETADIDASIRNLSRSLEKKSK